MLALVVHGTGITDLSILKDIQDVFSGYTKSQKESVSGLKEICKGASSGFGDVISNLVGLSDFDEDPLTISNFSGFFSSREHRTEQLN